MTINLSPILSTCLRYTDQPFTRCQGRMNQAKIDREEVNARPLPSRLFPSLSEPMSVVKKRPTVGQGPYRRDYEVMRRKENRDAVTSVPFRYARYTLYTPYAFRPSHSFLVPLGRRRYERRIQVMEEVDNRTRMLTIPT